MSTFISPIIGNSPINMTLNLPQEDIQFSELKNYILTLENNLKNQQEENNNLKKTIGILEQEKINFSQNLEKKEISIQELNIQFENNNKQIIEYQKKINELEEENKKLNYSIIESNQKNKSINENNNTNMNENDKYLNVLNKLNEIEITKSKLEFDNSKLINKINELKNEYENEMNLITKIKNGEIKQLERIISSLQEIINNNFKQNAIIEQDKINNQINYQYSHIIIEQISNFEKKINKLNEESFNLQKENNNIKAQLNKYINENQIKDNLIEELKQKNINSEELFKDNLNKLQFNNEEIINQIKESQNQIEKLIIERDELLKENNELRGNFQIFNKSLKEANDLFNEKTKSYNNEINNYISKIKDYRNKIQQLKLKINELYKDKENLKNKLNENQKRNKNQVNINLTSNQMTLKNEKINPIINNTKNTIKTKSYLTNNIISNYFDNDFISESQQKSLDEFKKVLLKIDENIENNKKINLNE